MLEKREIIPDSKSVTVCEKDTFPAVILCDVTPSSPQLII